MNLKELLQGKEVDFVIDYLGTPQDFPKKDGGTYEACEAKLKTTSNGEVYDNRFFPQQAQALKVGDTVRGYLNAKGYPQFDKVMSGESRNNTREVRKEREMATENKEGDAKQNEVVISQILHGFMKAAISNGKTTEEAAEIAKEAYFDHELAVKTIIDAKSQPTTDPVGNFTGDSTDLPF